MAKGDLLFLPNSTLSRKETVRRIRYLKPATSFRSGYAYDNILYMAAGQLIEEVSGQTWERYIHDHVFGPLGMNHSTDTDAEFQANPNHARPHSRSGGAIHGLGTQTPLDENATIAQNAAPAGGLAISANDMSRWLLTQLGRGKIPGSDKRLFSEEQSEQMWTGAVITPIPHYPAEFAVAQPHYDLYALGWDLSDYRGAQVVGHDGAVLGSQATVALLPDKNVGIFIAANSEDGEIIRGLLYELLDHYLGLPQDQWPEKWHEFKIDRLEPGRKAGAGGSRPSPPRSGPRFRSTATSATIPTRGTARSRSGNPARVSPSTSRTRAGWRGRSPTINTIRSRRTRSSTGSSPPMSASRSTRTGRSTG